ncbi:MaoC/PaaZ C-terminal domain-containing protein [Nocardioides sp.]|uniref:MaoC family dehydratase n=1 Tax=Nocardioides sp. TaxID=35761 RepID=UPI0026107E4D|nr:MaoC/PaaZ C-terminal domain-containing protein [Nocardioides sp.]MDI6912490.1 MaoC/PaaZ C-terminal domain-containing protein [Nocardioides sp.]
MPKLTEVEVGDSWSSVVVNDLSRTQIVMYAGASGDFNPLHTDEVWATKVAGYPAVIAHGQLIMALSIRAVTEAVTHADLVACGTRFLGTVAPGDTLQVTAMVSSVQRAEDSLFVGVDLVTNNQHGSTVASGYARLRDQAIKRSEKL